MVERGWPDLRPVVVSCSAGMPKNLPSSRPLVALKMLVWSTATALAVRSLEFVTARTLPAAGGRLPPGGPRGVASSLVSETIPVPLSVVADLRRARQRQRVKEIHWIDALYQVYIS